VSNQSIILKALIEKELTTVATGLTLPDYFEIFSAEQILKDYDLPYDSLENGITDGGNDGAIDSIFCFIDGEEMSEDPDYSNVRKNFLLEIYFIQSKSSGGFGETALRNMRDTVVTLLDLSKGKLELEKLYNEKVIERIEPARNTIKEAADKFPSVSVKCIQCCLEANDEPSAQTKAEATKLEQEIKQKLSSVNASVDFVGSEKLLTLKRKTPVKTLQLKVTESPISTASPSVKNSATAYLCLVNLLDYYDFITAGTNDIQKYIFESNVRDYQGKVTVNEQIRDTLVATPLEDFWWLNNGVTILAGKASLTGKVFTLEDPEVVNGLQTSNEIFNRYKSGKPSGESRTLLVRLIVTESSPTRDKIIRATNSQTSIPPASLRATDEIHRNIEDHFKNFGLFYDRRKNFYKNQGKAIATIVSISSLAQSLMTVLLSRPDSARSRPASLISNEATYKNLFDPNTPIECYLNSAKLLKMIEEQLRKVTATSAEKGEIKFYALYVFAHRICKKIPDIKTIATVAIDKTQDPIAKSAIDDTLAFFRGAGSGTSTKNQIFLQQLKTNLSL